MDEKEKEALMSSGENSSGSPAVEVPSARAKELAQQPDDSDAIFKVNIFIFTKVVIFMSSTNTKRGKHLLLFYDISNHLLKMHFFSNHLPIP